MLEQDWSSGPSGQPGPRSSTPIGLGGRVGLDHRRSITEFSVLGPLEIVVGGRAVVLRRGLPRVLLSSLLINRGIAVSTDTLVDHLWGENIPAHPANALQTQMAYLRRMLGGTAVAPIRTSPAGYVLDVTDLSVDIDRFEELLGHGRLLRRLGSHQHLDATVENYERALALWRATPYAEVAGIGFADVEIVRLEELRLLALEEKCDALLALDRSSQAAAELGALVTAHPLRERLQELLIVAQYRSGRQADALRTYTRARETLADELGVEPGPRLRELEQQVLAHDPRLDWVPPPDGGPPMSADLVPAPPALPSTNSTTVGELIPDGNQPSDCDLIGRDRELTRVSELLAECRLLTLTGPGGAGKSRLAMEAASRTSHRVKVMDLATVVDADVATAMLTELGGPAPADSEPTDSLGSALGSALGDGPLLLVLDTCEHVVTGLAPILEQLLAWRSDVTVLATSRRPLGVDGERAWPVPPLAVPIDGNDPRLAPAFQLFLRQARRVDPDLELDEAGVVAIAELCRALDGLPLAIELAAAQMDVLAPAAIRAHLAERTVLPVPGKPERQRTLWATTEWSIGLLDEAERDLLYRLAVFLPTFDLDAAVAVSGCNAPDAVERFVALVRSSLVSYVDRDRYRLLDTVRGHLTATEAEPQRVREGRRLHAEHYGALAARAFLEVRTPNQSTWMPRLQADLANLRQALAWSFGPDGDEQLGARFAGDIAWVWTLQGNSIDSQEALERARSVDAPPEVRARVLLGIGLLAAPLGDHDRVREACLESAEIGRSLDDDRVVADALLTLGVAHWASGEFEAAAASHDEATALFDRAGDRWGATICRILRARTARDMGDLELTEAALHVAIDDAKITGDDHVIGLAYEQYAWLSIARDDHDRAVFCAETCLRHNEALGYTEGICGALALLARVRLAQGDVDSATALQMRSLALSSGIGHVGAMCTALESMAEINAATGNPRQAALLLLHAKRARRDLPLPPIEAGRMDELAEKVRSCLGPEWDTMVRAVPLHSLGELVRSILDSPMQEAPD